MIYIYLIIIFVIILAAAAFLWFLVWTVIIGDIRGAPYVASRKEKIRLMLDFAKIEPGMEIVDLGSGDGTILLEAARRGARAVGLELSPFLVWFSKHRAKRAGYQDKIMVLRQNLFEYPLKNADIIFAYLWPETMERLGDKFLRECRPGTHIVSNAFPIKGWTAIMEKDNVYLYEIPNSKS